MGAQTRFCTIVPAITWSRKNTRKNKIQTKQIHSHTPTTSRFTGTHTFAYMALAHTDTHTSTHIHTHTNTHTQAFTTYTYS